jgi:hypothetical protein
MLTRLFHQIAVVLYLQEMFKPDIQGKGLRGRARNPGFNSHYCNNK